MTTVDTPRAAQLAIPLAGSAAPGPRLELRLGAATLGAPGKVNEDFYAVAAPSDADGAGRGVVLAVADGVSASGSGRPAAQSVVRSLTMDYYATPAQWSVGQSLDRLLRAANEWLRAQHGRWPDHDSVVAAVSLLVLRDQRYYLAHVGDTRVYRLRGRLFQQLTTDHTWQRRDMRHVLKRAVGLDSHLVVDFAEGDLEDGDSFLMVTDGVWEVLGDANMTQILRHRLEQPEAAAGALVDAAQRHQAGYMGRNDATAVVLSIRLAT
jgi:serine/threonine protein phosphatase PrpC